MSLNTRIIISRGTQLICGENWMYVIFSIAYMCIFSIYVLVPGCSRLQQSSLQRAAALSRIRACTIDLKMMQDWLENDGVANGIIWLQSHDWLMDCKQKYHWVCHHFSSQSFVQEYASGRVLLAYCRTVFLYWYVFHWYELLWGWNVVQWLSLYVLVPVWSVKAERHVAKCLHLYFYLLSRTYCQQCDWGRGAAAAQPSLVATLIVRITTTAVESSQKIRGVVTVAVNVECLA